MGKKMKSRVHYDRWLLEETQKAKAIHEHVTEEDLILGCYKFIKRDLEAGIVREPIPALNVTNIVKFHESGKQVFELGPRLVKMFKEMDMSNVTSEDMALPYTCFFISVPPGTMKIWGGQRTQFHDVSGIYVRDASSYYGEPGDMKITVMGEPNEQSVDFMDDACSWFCLGNDFIDKHGSVEAAVGAQLKREPAFAPWRDNLSLEGSVETAMLQALGNVPYNQGTFPAGGADVVAFRTQQQIMEGLLAKRQMQPKEINRRKSFQVAAEEQTPEEIAALEKHQYQVLVDAVRIVVNLLCYLDATNKEVELDESSERRRKRREAMQEEYFKMPEGSKRDKHVNTYLQLSSSTKYVIGRELEQRRESPGQHTVRCHWKMQAYGPKWSLRRKTLITDTVRGNPRKGLEKSRTYKLRERETDGAGS